MSGPSEEEVSRQWPLHWLVWSNDHKALHRLLEQKVYDKEGQDPRGRTPLHLAVTLNHRDCAEVLLYHGANVLALNRNHWSVLHEAICTGNAALVGMVLAVRDRQESNDRAKDIPLLLERLESSPDFYIEMTWEFTSWIPFLSRMCPSDTYKIWKKGTKVRVDTSLVGFQNMHWVRGNRSVLFEVSAKGAVFSEIDHDAHSVWEQPFVMDDRQLNPIQQMVSHELSVYRRLKSPVVSTVFNSQNVAFERQKSGIWGFRSDRTEVINGYKAKVFSASGLDIVTRTRVDHLPEEEKERQKSASASPLQDFLGMTQEEEEVESSLPAASGFLSGGGAVTEETTATLSMSEYFTPPTESKKYDAIGRKAQVYSRVQGIKATVWLSEEYPLSLQDQILPIIELMSLNNAHFAKLKDFITLQMPAGYPVKFEIPLFHVMSARVTFGNINGHTQPVPHVSLKTEEVVESAYTDTISNTGTTVNPIIASSSSVKRRHASSESEPSDTPTLLTTPPSRQLKEVCIISDEAFTRPPGYRVRGGGGGDGLAEQEEEILQMAIRQSLMEQGQAQDKEEQTLSLTEALSDQTVQSFQQQSHTPSYSIPSDCDLELALAISQVQANESIRLQEEEDEELMRVLKLSLTDK